jgi:uncharacterized protein YaaR (DUF327 family)
MDIERLSQIGSPLDARFKKRKESGKAETGKSGRTVFSSILGKVSEETKTAAEVLGTVSLPELDGSESVESLLDDVHEKGEALKKDSVFGPLNGYKTAVRRFLRYVIENGFEMEETLGVRNPRTMQQKKYVIIRVVDERLESLAAHVLRNQADQLDILRRIDEIHGMLVDLTG